MDHRGLRARLAGAGCTPCGAAVLVDPGVDPGVDTGVDTAGPGSPA